MDVAPVWSLGLTHHIMTAEKRTMPKAIQKPQKMSRFILAPNFPVDQLAGWNPLVFGADGIEGIGRFSSFPFCGHH